MHEHAPAPIRTAALFPVKLLAILRFVLVVKRLILTVDLTRSMSKLTFIPIATISTTRFNPIFAKLSLILGRVDLLKLLFLDFNQYFW